MHYYSGADVTVTLHLDHRTDTAFPTRTYSLDLERFTWDAFEGKSPVFNPHGSRWEAVRPGTRIVAGRLALNLTETKWFEQRMTHAVNSPAFSGTKADLKLTLFLLLNQPEGERKGYRFDDIRLTAVGTSIIPSGAPQMEEYQFIARSFNGLTRDGVIPESNPGLHMPDLGM